MRDLAAIAVFVAVVAALLATAGSGVVLNFVTMALYATLLAQAWNLLGGMGSFGGALLGGLLIGVVESVGGLLFGASLGQAGIYLIFIAVLLLRPQGLFGSRA